MTERPKSALVARSKRKSRTSSSGRKPHSGRRLTGAHPPCLPGARGRRPRASSPPWRLSSLHLSVSGRAEMCRHGNCLANTPAGRGGQQQPGRLLQRGWRGWQERARTPRSVCVTREWRGGARAPGSGRGGPWAPAGTVRVCECRQACPRGGARGTRHGRGVCRDGVSTLPCGAWHHSHPGRALARS